MAKAPIPVGFAKAAMSGSLGVANWTNVFYLAIEAEAHTPGEVIADIAENMHNLYESVITPSFLSADWSLTSRGITYRDATDSTVRVRVADSLVGEVIGQFQAAQVSYLVNWSTGDPRKGGKPRTYICGVPDAYLDGAVAVDTAVITTFDANVITWLESLPTGPGSNGVKMQLVEMSFVNAGVDRDPPHNYPIIGGVMNQIVATQRRRVDRLRFF
jgi:hypothetical protein